MRVLVTGVNGLVGTSIAKLLSKKKYNVLLTSRKKENLATQKLDISSINEVNKTISDFKPDVVINSAAMANVDLCEVEKELCWNTNVNGVDNLVKACLKYNCHLVHISTDYIFDGLKEGGIYHETDLPNPQGVYAESKLEAEKIIIKSGVDASILRTILVYGKHKNLNIVTFIKQSLEENKEVKLVDDQIRMPTFVDDLSNACITASERRSKGVFNISGKEQMSYLEIGNIIADHFSLDKKYIKPVKTKDLNQKAKRPFKTGFDLSKSFNELDYNPRGFVESLDLIY